MNSNVNKQVILYIGFVLFLFGLGGIAAILYKIYQVWFAGTEIDLMSWLFMVGFAATSIFIGYRLLKQNK